MLRLFGLYIRVTVLMSVLAFVLGVLAPGDPAPLPVPGSTLPSLEEDSESSGLLFLAVAASLRPKPRPQAVSLAAARLVPKPPVAQPDREPAVQTVPSDPVPQKRRKRKRR